MAKILATSLNCVQGPTVSPCGVCPSCQSARDGVSMDVIEIDAASNRRIDDIRELKDNTLYAPAKGHAKVYIIDEVHMMTPEAFNAFLKLLEEPPAHVIFVLATTEPNKVPATIISRCQWFDFRPLTMEQIVKRLKEVAQAEKIEVSEEALALIAEKAGGSLRDALSSFEQMATCMENKVQTKEVVKFLGLIEQEVVFKTAQALINQDTAAIMSLISEVAASGYDLRQFVQALLKHFRNLLVCAVIKDVKKLKGLLPYTNTQQLQDLSQQAQDLSEVRIRHCLGALNSLNSQLKLAFDPKLELEVALVKLTANEAAVTEKTDQSLSLSQEKEVLTRAGHGSSLTTDTQKQTSSGIVPAADGDRQGMTPWPAVESLEDSSAQGVFNAVVSRWEHLTNHSRFSLKSYFKSCRPLAVEGGVLRIGFAVKPLEKISEQIKDYLKKELASLGIKSVEIVEEEQAEKVIKADVMTAPEAKAEREQVGEEVQKDDLLAELGAEIVNIEEIANDDKI